MNAIPAAIAIVVGTVVVVSVVYVVGTHLRTGFSELRSRDKAPRSTTQREGFVDSLAWSLRWGEVTNTDPAESHESMGGPPTPGGPG